MSNPNVFRYADEESVPQNDPSKTSSAKDAKRDGADKGVTSDSSVETSTTTSRSTPSVSTRQA